MKNAEQKVAISIVDSEGESGDTRDGIWLEVDDRRLFSTDRNVLLQDGKIED